MDASALVKLIVTEPESLALRAYLTGHRLRLTSRVAFVEVSRAIARHAPAAGAPLAAAFEGVAVIELDAEVAARAGVLLPAAMRSLDAIHVASALALEAELDAFVTYDARLADAAASAGLPVIAPT